MHLSSTTVTYILAFSLRLTLANPVSAPQWGGLVYPWEPHYSITRQTTVGGTVQQLPDNCTPKGEERKLHLAVRCYSANASPPACTLGSALSYSVGVTITAGASFSLDLKEIFNIGITFSVSTEETNGVTDSVDTLCKGLWTCFAIIRPTVVQVDEVKWTTAKQWTFDNCGKETGNPYTVQYPALSKDHNPIIHAEACTCQNYPNFADPKAPPFCPSNC